MQFNQNRDVATMILDLLLISDLAAISCTCRFMSILGTEVVQRRFKRTLQPFVGSHLQSFICALRNGNALITGSSVRAIVGAEETGIARDLNILVPYQGFEALHAMIKFTMGFKTIARHAHPVLAPFISTFRKYVFKGQIITLSASHKSQSILHIILNAPTTADMLFMTTGGLCYFYPEWFHARVAVKSHSGDLVPCDNKLGCAGDIIDEFEVENGLAFLGRSCGELCPTYWHHIQDKHLRLSIDWDVDDSVCNILNNADVEWRLNTHCVNRNCPYRITVMSHNLEGVGACHRDDVKFLPPEIRWRKPRFIQLIKGIFYGAGCHRPFIVPIPVRDGVDKLPTLDDLDVNYWVKQRELNECTSTRRHFRHTFSAIPGSNLTIEGKYTVFWEKPRTCFNRSYLLSRMASMSGSRKTVHGSVLVVKQTGDVPSHMINVTKDDQLVSNFLISSALHYRVLM